MNNVVIDNNVLISYLISENSTPGQVVSYCIENDRLFTSPKILEELQEKLSKPKFKKYFDAYDAIQFTNNYSAICKQLTPTSKINICRDPKDNMFLELLSEIRIDYLITGDKDLLTLLNFKESQIVTPKEYLLLTTN